MYAKDTRNVRGLALHLGDAMSLRNASYHHRPSDEDDYIYDTSHLPDKLRKPRLNGFTIFGIVVAIVYLIGWACSR